MQFVAAVSLSKDFDGTVWDALSLLEQDLIPH